MKVLKTDDVETWLTLRGWKRSTFIGARIDPRDGSTRTFADALDIEIQLIDRCLRDLADVGRRHCRIA